MIPTYRCEVLILGGGILGLWVLHRLLDAKNQSRSLLEYQSPVLLESDLLGCRQTGHSDAFLHQGYAYYTYSGVEVFLDSWNAWQPWLPVPVPPTVPPPAYHVYLDTTVYQAAVAWRQNPILPAPPVPPNYNAQNPAVGILHDAIETDERCVPGDWIVGQLYTLGRDHIRKIREVQQIAFAAEQDGSLRVDSVTVLMDDGNPGRFEPNTLLLCAGESNQDLLAPHKLVFPPGASAPTSFAALNQLQRSTEMDMLVARDRSGTLPDENGSVSGGVFSDGKGQYWSADAFLVSRRDLNGDLVWIISGWVYRTDAAGNRQFPITGRQRRRMLIDYLAKIFSANFGQSYQNMIWGVYPARLTTWNSGKKRTVARKTVTTMGIEGLLVCYTDRLTITPLAAEAIEQEISSNLRLRWPSASVPMPGLPAGPVAIHPEYWRTPGRWEQQTSWPWAEFQANCL